MLTAPNGVSCTFCRRATASLSLTSVTSAFAFTSSTVPSVSPVSGSQTSSPSRSEEHTSELQSHSDLHSFPTRRSSDLDGEPVFDLCNLGLRLYVLDSAERLARIGVPDLLALGSEDLEEHALTDALSSSAVYDDLIVSQNLRYLAFDRHAVGSFRSS